MIIKFNPDIRHRKSYRLAEYDYSQQGLYFITICCAQREYFFGRIENDEMKLNDIGNIAEQYWIEIPEHFPDVVLHEHVVMPNHVHGIIELVGTRHGVSDKNQPDIPNVGTRHGVSDKNQPDIPNVGTRHGVSLQKQKNQFGKPVPRSIPVIINQYKSSVKRTCNMNGHKFFKWQSRFHDHIIRNEQAYQNIAEYIINNPRNWKEDKFFK